MYAAGQSTVEIESSSLDNITSGICCSLDIVSPSSFTVKNSIIKRSDSIYVSQSMERVELIDSQIYGKDYSKSPKRCSA